MNESLDTDVQRVADGVEDVASRIPSLQMTIIASMLAVIVWRLPDVTTALNRIAAAVEALGAK